MSIFMTFSRKVQTCARLRHRIKEKKRHRKGKFQLLEDIGFPPEEELKAEGHSKKKPVGDQSSFGKYHGRAGLTVFTATLDPEPKVKIPLTLDTKLQSRLSGFTKPRCVCSQTAPSSSLASSSSLFWVCVFAGVGRPSCMRR